MNHFSTLLLILSLAALAAGVVAHTRADDARRADLAACRGDVTDARADRDAEHAVADACLRVVERCGVAVDELCECGGHE